MVNPIANFTYLLTRSLQYHVYRAPAHRLALSLDITAFVNNFAGACLVMMEIYVTGRAATPGLFAVRARGRLKYLITLPIDLISTCKIGTSTPLLPSRSSGPQQP